MRMVRALESVVVTRFLQSAIWMGGSWVRCSRGMAGFILVVRCIAGYFLSTSIRGSRYGEREEMVFTCRSA